MEKHPKERQKLKGRQKRFVKHYLIEPNATKAAISAGYSENGAEVTGCRLLKNPKVKAAIEEGEAKIAEKLDITAGYVLEKIKDTIERCLTEKFRPAAVLRGLELLGRYIKLENRIEPGPGKPLPLGFDKIIFDAPRPDRSLKVVVEHIGKSQEAAPASEKQGQGNAEPVAPVEKPEPTTPVITIDRKLVN